MKKTSVNNSNGIITMKISIFILLNRNLAASGTGADFLLLGGISITLLGMFLYLVYDYTDRKNSESTGKELKIGILKKNIPVLDDIIRKRVNSVLHDHFKNDSENFDLWLHREGNVYIVYSSKLNIQKVQEFPEAEIQNRLMKNLIVHFRDYYYFPVISDGNYSGFFAVRINGSPSRKKAAILLEKIESAINDMERIQNDLLGFTDESGLFSRDILIENIENRFYDEKRFHLCLIQLHGWDNNESIEKFSGAFVKHMGNIPLYHFETNIAACIMTASEFSDFRLKIGEVHADAGGMDFSAGVVANRDASSEQVWLDKSQRLLRQACFAGANYIKYN